MKTITVTKAWENLYRLLNEAIESHEPIQNTGKRANAVLVSEEDWRTVQETLYLLSIHGMRESIVEGMERHHSTSAPGNQGGEMALSLSGPGRPENRQDHHHVNSL